MWAQAKKYMPYILVAVAVLYFRREILKAMPRGVQSFFGGAA